MRIGSVVLAFAGTSAGVRGDRLAFAQESACRGVRVHGASDLTPAWSSAIDHLRAELPPAPTAGCAAITLALDPAAGNGARLAAMTVDGRFAERIVSRPSDLVPTALGVVASIPDELAVADAPASGSPPPTLGPAPVPASPALDPASSLSLPGAPPAKKPIGLWLGASGGFRLGWPFAYQMIDLEARIDLLLSQWLLTLSFRYAPSVGPDTSDVVYEETVLGVGVGRRLPLGRGSLDLNVTPEIAAMNLAWDQDDSDGRSGASTTLRVDLAARWATPLSAKWWFTVTADGDISPSGLASERVLGPEAPALPVWTAGLRLGASGALL